MHRGRILIADDDVEFAQMISILLRKKDFDPVHVTGGNLAQAYLRDNLSRGSQAPITAIVSDWIMPEGSGIDLLKAVRSDPSLRAMPFLLISGMVTAEQLNQAVALDADAVLLKPFTTEAFLAKIEEALTFREKKELRRLLS